MSPPLHIYGNRSLTLVSCIFIACFNFSLWPPFPLPHFLISVLFHKQQCSSEVLIIDPRARISRRKKSCLIVLNVLYSISCVGQNIPFTVGWMIVGGELRSLNGFLGQNNRSYWPHSGDNTLSSCFPFLCLSFTLTRNRGFIRFPMSKAWSRREMTYTFIKSFMESICVRFQPKMLPCSKLLRCVIRLLYEIANSHFYHVFAFWQWFCVCSAISKTG